MIRISSIPRHLIIIAAAALGMIGYIYLTPPASQLSLAERLNLDVGLEAEHQMYVQRFGVAFIMLGILPVLAARISGFKLSELGVRMPRCTRPPVWLVAAVAGGVIIGLVGVFSPSLSTYYPYDSGLAERVSERGMWPFLLHSAAYLICYYLPWELLFRGVLIFPLLDIPADQTTVSSRALFLASLQAIPSSLLHFGHPLEETIGAVFFGIAAAWIVLKTRSIIPVLLLHAAAGISLDLFIVLGLG